METTEKPENLFKMLGCKSLKLNSQIRWINFILARKPRCKLIGIKKDDILSPEININVEILYNTIAWLNTKKSYREKLVKWLLKTFIANKLKKKMGTVSYTKCI